MDNVNQSLRLSEAGNRFLAELSTEDKAASQQEVFRFVRWFGGERPLAGLTPAEVANYAERLSLSDTNYLGMLKTARAFLAHARKKGWSQTNLSVHLKTKKSRNGVKVSARSLVAEPVLLSRQGYADLEAELSVLHAKRMESIDEIRKAAADKDFRENVPLQAAREQRGHLEGRIMRLEATLKSAIVIDAQPKTTIKVSVGDCVILCDLDSGAEMQCQLVGAREVDPAKGRISGASPIGKAIVGKESGETVEVAVPAGKRRYQIKQVKH
ncbi:MAG: transcription elongation factor GreA, partial [Chloroflexi bacterium]|nr:transcription elongation factor GreA [Chloroflexota bacterium]